MKNAQRLFRNSSLLSVILGVYFFAAPPAFSFTVIGSTSAAGSSQWSTVVIDSATGFAYFGSTGTPGGFFGEITRVNLNDFSQVTGLAFALGGYSAAAVDPVNRNAYFVTARSPLEVHKFSFAFEGLTNAVLLDTGWNKAGSTVIDPINGFLYVGTLTTPGRIAKVRLSDLVVVASMTVTGSGPFTAAFIDTSNGFAYFGTNTSPGSIVKLKLSDFTVASTLTLAAGEGGIGSAVIDSANARAYLGTLDSPGKLIVINLSLFIEVRSVTMASGEDRLLSAVLDTLDGFVYFGTGNSPAKILRVQLSSFGEFSALTLAAGQNSAAAVAATQNQFAFFGLLTNPAQAVLVDLNAGTPAIQTQPQDATVTPGQSTSFGVTASGRSLAYQWQRDGVDISGATANIVTLANIALTDNGAGFSCNVSNSSGTVRTRTAVLTVTPVIRVFPNPWRIDRHLGAPITFDQMANNSTVKLFTLSAHWVKTLQGATGTATWDLTNDAGQRVASGYYFYLITTPDDRQTVHGKLGIIK